MAGWGYVGYESRAGLDASSAIDASLDAIADIDAEDIAPALTGDLVELRFDDNPFGRIAYNRAGNLRHGNIRMFYPVQVEGRYGSTFALAGRGQQSIALHGAGDQLTSASLTIEAWINQSEAGVEDFVFGDFDYDAPFSYQLSIGPNGLLRFRVGEGCAPGFLEVTGGAATFVSVGQWTHIAATWNGSTLQFFVNGALADSQPLVATPCPSTAEQIFWIGATNNVDEGFVGRIDELRVSSRIKSGEEIALSMAYDSSLAPGTCGNGVLDDGEACEGDAPCCEACALASQGSPCASAGTCNAGGVCNDGGPRPQSGLVALYNFDEGAGATVSDSAGDTPGLDLTIADPANVTWGLGFLEINQPTVIASPSATQKIVDPIRASGAMTIEAWVVPANLSQGGPARIASLSPDTTQRNALVGQERDAWLLRVRTRHSSNNGEPMLGTPTNSAGLKLTHLMVTSDSSGLRRFFVDGVELGRGVVTGEMDNWNSSFPLVLGNEPTRNRAWLGQLHRIAIYDRALAPIDVQRAFLAGP